MATVITTASELSMQMTKKLLKRSWMLQNLMLQKTDNLVSLLSSESFCWATQTAILISSTGGNAWIGCVSSYSSLELRGIEFGSFICVPSEEWFYSFTSMTTQIMLDEDLCDSSSRHRNNILLCIDKLWFCFPYCWVQQENCLGNIPGETWTSKKPGEGCSTEWNNHFSRKVNLQHVQFIWWAELPQVWVLVFSQDWSPEALPPTSDTLGYHIQRTHCQTMVWGQANCNNPTLPSPKNMGWIKHNRELAPKLTSLEPSLNSCTEIVTCVHVRLHITML